MKNIMRTALAVGLVTALAAPAFAVDKLTTEKEKVSYMVGMDMGQSLGPIKDSVDIAIVVQALQASLKGEKTLLSADEANTVRQEFMNKMRAEQTAKVKAEAEKNKAAGEKFLADNKGKPGVKTTASGLQYVVLKQGTGKKPAATDKVKVHYLGTLIDGTKFDSSYDRNAPAEFALNGVIPGWTEALQLMAAGSKYKLFIPSALAYGENDPPGPIGPNATLVFEVELLEVQ
jgi:FKBP-type peptidyl-prolyl cis-trans isomerase FkpA/FKBP-type peptidyl-prolyl cis-trans isomerase FklB